MLYYVKNNLQDTFLSLFSDFTNKKRGLAMDIITSSLLCRQPCILVFVRKAMLSTVITITAASMKVVSKSKNFIFFTLKT
jgi:hypothetical protein